MLGPLLICDKSFVQMLNPEEISELTLYFSLVDTPPLRSEVIADFNKPEGSRQLPDEVVKALAKKMSIATGVRPADFWKIAGANLCGQYVSMIGQVPVDASAPNVTESDGMLMYDSVPQQRTWRRMATGDLNNEDYAEATAWQDGIQQVDLQAIRASWKAFVQEKLGSSSTLLELISEVDGLLSDKRPQVQLELLEIALALFRAPEEMRNHVFQRMLDNPGSTVERLAPYANSILRLHLTFVGGLVRGFIGPRQSHYVDLQYLFYAPFCMIFVSADKLQRALWPAASGINSFAWGPDLKGELAERIAARNRMSQEERETIATEYQFYPIEVPGSIITEAWLKYMRPKEEIIRPPGRAKTIDDLEPRVRDMIRAAQRKFEARDEAD